VIRDDPDIHLKWCDALRLLSLDRTTAFRNELGLGDLDTEALRDLARGFMTVTHIGLDRDAFTREFPESFFSTVRNQLGNSVLEALKAWFDASFPNGDAHECLASWYYAFRELAEQWVTTKAMRSTPLGATEHTEYRLSIRRFLAEHITIHSETRLLTAESEWDRLFEAANMENAISGLMLWVLHDRLRLAYLPMLFAQFPKAEIAGFRKWWSKHSEENYWPDECLAMLPE